MILKRNSCDGVYQNSLDVRFTKACDNRCDFCIEHNGIDALKQDVQKMIESTLESARQTVLILGGEPFLSPEKLLKYVAGIRSGVKEIFITTSLPKVMDVDNPTVSKIMDLIDGLNVSIQHFNPMINNSVLKATSNHNRIELLRKLSSKYGSKIRINLNLVKGYLDSKESITQAITILSSMGVNEIKLNELQNVGFSEYVSYEATMEKKMKSPFVFGCQTDISDHWNVESKILLKRACLFVQPKEYQKASFLDFVKAFVKFKILKNKAPTQKVLYENGSLNDGWIQKE